MCINKEVSLITFLFSWGIGFYLLKRNYQLDRWYGLLLLTFSSMQFIDYLLWVLHDKNMLDSNYNLILTSYIIPVILLAQIFSVYIGKLIFENNNKFTNLSSKIYKDINKNVFPKILILYSLLILSNLKFNKGKTKIGKDRILDWNGVFNKNNKFSILGYSVFLILLTYPFLKYYNKFASTKIILIFTLLSLLFSFVYTENVGSYWCWIANSLGIIFLFSPYLDI